MIGCVVDTDVDLIVEVVDIEVVGVVVVDDWDVEDVDCPRNILL
jgi:hypothetical protein